MNNFIIGEYGYTQEVWDDCDWELGITDEILTYLLYDAHVSGLSDVFWGDCFFPEDNYLYPEFRYFFIFTDEIPLFWV
jgi:hypothetical protein